MLDRSHVPDELIGFAGTIPCALDALEVGILVLCDDNAVGAARTTLRQAVADARTGSGTW